MAVIILPGDGGLAGQSDRGILPFTTVAFIPDTVKHVMIEGSLRKFLHLQLLEPKKYWGFYDLRLYESHNGDVDKCAIQAYGESGKWLDEGRGIYEPDLFTAMYTNDTWKVDAVIQAERNQAKLCHIGIVSLPVHLIGRTFMVAYDG